MTFTITTSETPENRDKLDLIRAWDKSIPTLYFLDICSISHIKKSQSAALSDNFPRQESLKSLEAIDLPHNGISYLPALMEKASDKNSKFSIEELTAEAERDLKALRDFFKKAKIYESEELAFKYINELKGVQPEILGEKYHSFLNYANEFGIYNPLADNKKLKAVEALCNESDRLGIIKSHPVVLASLACIYGCLPAKKVMKFKKNPDQFNSSNALGDILMIQRIAQLTQMIEDAGSSIRTSFFTDDNSLREFYEIFFVNDVCTELNDEGSMSTAFKMTAKGNCIFPDLYNLDGTIKDDKKEQELFKIYELIGCRF